MKADMATHPEILRTIDDLRRSLRAWRAAGERIGLAPTMGALHAGHLSLVSALAPHVDRIIVSIFVNPTQFGEGEDFGAYPREEAADIAKLSGLPVDLVYAPTTAEMYPPGMSSRIQVGGVTGELEGAYRPGHFDGVATVVMKLFQQSGCDAAIFGEKDYQQLVVIRRMVADLDLPVEIFAAPIVREADGLAASSRNAYLDPQQRAIAPALQSTLQDLKQRAEAGEGLSALEAEGRQMLLSAGFDAVDYCTFRDAGTLSHEIGPEGEARLLAVARLGRTRLLDNLPVTLPKS